MIYESGLKGMDLEKRRQVLQRLHICESHNNGEPFELFLKKKFQQAAGEEYYRSMSEEEINEGIMEYDPDEDSFDKLPPKIMDILMEEIYQDDDYVNSWVYAETERTYMDYDPDFEKSVEEVNAELREMGIDPEESAKSMIKFVSEILSQYK